LYFDDKHSTLKADYVLANPPFSDEETVLIVTNGSRASTTPARAARDSSAKFAHSIQSVVTI
jgi:type I restriction-modification system DNA methylase subunit